MKRIGRALLCLALFLVMLIILAPKANLYYLAEKQLAPQGVVIDGEALSDRGFGLEIGHATLYAQQIESASAERIVVDLFGLYNRVVAEKVTFSKPLQKFWPAEVNRAEVSYALWDPMHVIIDAEGDFGSLKGVISLADRTVTARLEPSQLMLTRFRATLRQLKKDETGGYRYESRF